MLLFRGFQLVVSSEGVQMKEANINCFHPYCPAGEKPRSLILRIWLMLMLGSPNEAILA